MNIGHTTDGKKAGLDLQKLVDTRLLIQANSGGGKSWMLRLIAEQSSQQVPTIILDPEGEFFTLREKVDCVLVGREGEVPADPRSASLLARRLMELNVSAVVDLYDLKLHERRHFVRMFLESLMTLPRSLWRPTIVMLDESHVFCPDRSAGESESTNAVISLMSQGRKRGYCGILATQRLAKLHKDAAAETNNVMIGRTWLDNDLKRAGDVLGMSKADAAALRELEAGHFYGFGPAMAINGVFRFAAGEVKTTHPKAGSRHKMSAPRPSQAIQKVIGELTDLPKQAEAEAKDMQAATAKIKDLEKQLKSASKAGCHPVADQSAIERAVAQALKQRDAEWAGKMKPLEASRNDLAKRLMKIESLAHLNGDGASLAQITMDQPRIVHAVTQENTRGRTPVDTKTASRPKNDPPAGGLKGPQQRILDAIMVWESLGVQQPTTAQVGMVAGIKPKGGHFSNTLGPLSTGGLIERHGDATVSLTDAGREQARPSDRGLTLDDYHDNLLQLVKKGPTRRILQMIMSAGGEALSVSEIGDAVGIDCGGGHFSNSIGPLSTLGLIDRQQGIVRPTELLFPKALA